MGYCEVGKDRVESVKGVYQIRYWADTGVTENDMLIVQAWDNQIPAMFFRKLQ